MQRRFCFTAPFAILDDGNQMLRFSCLFFVIIVLGSSSAAGQNPAQLKNSPTLAVTGSGIWKLVQRGIEARKIELTRADSQYTVELKILRIDTRWVTPRILLSSQYQLKGASAKVFAEKSGAIAAVNANYFDEKGSALGFLKSHGEEVNRNVSKSSLFTGIFGMQNAAPFIVQRDEFQSGQADEALQSGPLLLNRGVSLEVVRGIGRYARRTVIGIDKAQRIVVGVTDTLLGGLSWGELQEIFIVAQWQLETPNLLNLDGGGSAQLYIKTGHFEELVPGTAEVPVAIGFFNRAN